MVEKDRMDSIDRRAFMKTTAAAVAGTTLLGGGEVAARVGDDGLDRRNERPDLMQYRQLGKTKFMASRLAFGCGAALAGGKAVRLLDHAFEAGINFYDSSSNRAYKGTEAALAPFLKKHRDGMWVSSKAVARFPRGEKPTLQASKDAAKLWLETMDRSLANLECEYLDSYYLLGVADPEVVKNEEMYGAFLKAKEAGKVRHYGFSTHENAEECLEAAIETGWYSLAMVAVTPAGWYDLRSRAMRADRGSLKELRPLLDKARGAGIGIIGMKAARYLSSSEAVHREFDLHYDDKLLEASLNTFQRSYAYLLENGLDIVNADMQNVRHFEQNLHAARSSRTFFA